MEPAYIRHCAKNRSTESEITPVGGTINPAVASAIHQVARHELLRDVIDFAVGGKTCVKARIAFGGDNQSDYRRLQTLALRKVSMLICVGSDNRQLHEVFQHAVPTIIDVENIGAAVHAACYSGITDATVLFSPATRHGLSDETAGLLFRHEVNEL